MKVLYVGEGANFAGIERYAITLIKRISTDQEVSVLCGLFYQGPLADELRARNVEVVPFHGSRNIRSFLDMDRFIREENIDIVHFLDLKAVLVGGFACLLNRKVKTVATMHGLAEVPRSPAGVIKYRLALALYYLCLRLVIDRVICVSVDLAGHLRKKIGQRKLCVIHNGIDQDQHDSHSAPLKAADSHLIVGTVSRLDRVKGLEFLLKAAKKVLETHEHVVFQIAGRGPLEEELRRQAKNLGIGHKVFFLGFHRDILSLVQCFDLFVLPSLHEGVPYALLEAMSLAKPVVCSRVGGLEEIITEGVDGLFVPPGQPDALANAISLLISNPRYRAKLGAQAKYRVETEFAAQAMAARTKNVYYDLVARAVAITPSKKQTA